MNCKQGDIALIVRADHAINLGRLVEVLRPSGPDGWWTRMVGTPGVNNWGVCQEAFAYDDRLRPIRDDEGADETLTWAGKPQEVTA